MSGWMCIFRRFYWTGSQLVYLFFVLFLVLGLVIYVKFESYLFLFLFFILIFYVN